MANPIRKEGEKVMLGIGINKKKGNIYVEMFNEKHTQKEKMLYMFYETMISIGFSKYQIEIDGFPGDLDKVLGELSSENKQIFEEEKGFILRKLPVLKFSSESDEDFKRVINHLERFNTGEIRILFINSSNTEECRLCLSEDTEFVEIYCNSKETKEYLFDKIFLIIKDMLF